MSYFLSYELTSFGMISQKVTALNSRVEGASVPSATKADLKAKIYVLQVLLTLKSTEY